MNSEIPAKKTLGQHWLNDPLSLKTICQLAELNTSDTVLEIGPGTGNLTKLLAQAAGKVVAVEFDTNLADRLTKQNTATNMEIELGDIRQFNFSGLPPGYKIVANIPYYLTAYLLRLLTTVPNKPALAVLLVQKEVAQRVAAPAPRASFLSVVTQLYYEVSLGPVVEAKLFTPAPKVDSQVLILKHSHPKLGDINERELVRLVKLGFAQPRKTLANNLSSGFALERQMVELVLSQLGLTNKARAQELTLKQWAELYLAIKLS